MVDDREGDVNAWPLDECLIAYVDDGCSLSEENALLRLNVIAAPKFTLSGKQVDATKITPALLKDTLKEAGGLEANVTSGHHAIKFLLWSQDLHDTALLHKSCEGFIS